MTTGDPTHPAAADRGNPRRKGYDNGTTHQRHCRTFFGHAGMDGATTRDRSTGTGLAGRSEAHSAQATRAPPTGSDGRRKAVASKASRIFTKPDLWRLVAVRSALSNDGAFRQWAVHLAWRQIYRPANRRGPGSGAYKPKIRSVEAREVTGLI